MNHAILGAGGVGGLVGAALATSGDRVTLLLRPGTPAGDHPDRLSVESPFGTMDVAVERATGLSEPVDVLWITVKATQLDAALAAVPPDAATRIGAIVPLLNGIDHVALLRARYGDDRVVPGTIAVEAERIAPGRIRHRTPFANIELSAIGEPRLAEMAERLRRLGFGCVFRADERRMLWSKLGLLAPLALTTTAADAPIGQIRTEARWRLLLEACVGETAAVAGADGGAIDAVNVLAAIERLPAAMRSSMQKDVGAGRPPELDAIAGPVVRGGAANGIAVDATRELMMMIEERVRARRAISDGERSGSAPGCTPPRSCAGG